MVKEVRIEKNYQELILNARLGELEVEVEQTIEDEQYDALEAELTKLDPQNPALSVVGSQFFTGEKFKHDEKMLSLDKKYEKSELESWLGRETAVATFKIDGSSASLICDNGVLSLAKTRGDGQFGENISQGVFHIPNVPSRFESVTYLY